MRCLYCGYSEGKHSEACPESMSGDAKVQAHKVWQDGYRLGRGALSLETKRMLAATYNLGYGQGVVALEEAENGHDPRFDDVSADSAAHDSDDDIEC